MTIHMAGGDAESLQFGRGSRKAAAKKAATRAGYARAKKAGGGRLGPAGGYTAPKPKKQKPGQGRPKKQKPGGAKKK